MDVWKSYKFDELSDEYKELFPKSFIKLVKDFDLDVEIWTSIMLNMIDWCKYPKTKIRKFAMILRQTIIDALCSIKHDKINSNLSCGDIVAVEGNTKGKILSIVWKNKEGKIVIFKCQCGEKFFPNTIFDLLEEVDLTGNEVRLFNILSGQNRKYFQSFIAYILLGNDERCKDYEII